MQGLGWAVSLALAFAIGCSGAAFTSSGSDAGSSGGRAGAASGGASGVPNPAGGTTSGSGGSPSSKGGTSAGGTTTSSGGVSAGGTTTSSGGVGAGGTTTSSGGVSAGGTTTGSGGVSAGGTIGAGGVSASGGNGGEPDAGSVVCTGPDSFVALAPKNCSTSADCGLVQHERDCCGTELLLGINVGSTQAFKNAETVCDATAPRCACVPQGVFAEDGTEVALGDEALIGAICDNGTCHSVYSGRTYTCGDRTCTDQQYCLGPSFACPFLPAGCSSCGCITLAAGCTCTTSNGEAVVLCPT